MMITAPAEGLGQTSLRSNRRTHRRLSVGESEAELRKDQDEAELYSAALERAAGDSKRVLLPPKGKDGKEPRVADVTHLTRTQRQVLVSETLETEDQDTMAFLKKSKERRDRVGVTRPRVEVRFQDLTIDAKIAVGASSLPSVYNAFRNFIEDIAATLRLLKVERRKFVILDNISGIIPPNRICLLLGPPGAGKSILLQALAGKLRAIKGLQVHGDILYNGTSFDKFVPERTAAYVTQYDEHFAELTVRETIDFSRRVQGSGNRQAEVERIQAAEKEKGIQPDPYLAAFLKAETVEGKQENIETDYVLHMLGLNVCSETMVGSQMIRGISGGQKKRLTTAEILGGPAQTLFMDEISTGLDSSTTFQITRCLRDLVHVGDATALIALLQPAPEVYDLFDDVLLLAEGHILFHGPVGEVMEFFRSIGFDIPARKGIPDFLQEVSGLVDQKQYWAKQEPYRYVPVIEIAEAFRNSKWGKQNAAALAEPPLVQEDHPEALVTKKYALSSVEQLNACMFREWTLIKRTAFIYVFKTSQVAIMGIVTATLFLRTQVHPRSVMDGNKYAAYTFFSLLLLIFNGIAEMSITVERLANFTKQRDNLYYTGLAYCTPATILRFPYSALEAVVWTALTYWEIGMAPTASRFFVFLLLCFLVHQWSCSFFRCVGAVCRNLTVANAVGLMFMLIVFLTGGFVITKQNIHPWVVWMYWMSPMQYAQRAYLINEFTAPRWQRQIYPGTGPYSGQTLGNGLLSQFGFPHHYWWVWVGVGALIGYNVLFNVVLIWAHNTLGGHGGEQSTKSEEQLGEREEALHGTKGGHHAPDTAVSVTDNGKSSNNGMDASHKSSLKGKGEDSSDFEPMTLTFRDLHYLVPLPPQQADSPNAVVGENGQKELELLKGINGAFRPDTLTALMGVTGAGKTTLMDVLAGRKTGGRIIGDIRLNGHPKVQETFARVSGYVEQTDIHQPFTTVMEALTFSAHLRYNNPPSSAAVDAHVKDVMKLVELETLKGSLVGRPGESGLSVEQRKRLTIAVELVANPSIIFMDEPTSGLDARAAAIVMRTVRSIVDTGRTVVCTIHQPSISIFEAFDLLLLLKRGGETSFFGLLGEHSSTLVKYFEGIDGVPPISEGINPATWMLEVSTVGAEARMGVDFADIYRNSSFATDVLKVLDENAAPKEGSQPLHFDTKFAQNPMGQYRLLTQRYMATYWRTTEYNAVRYLLTCLIALMFGFIFWKLGGHVRSQLGIQAVLGALYASTIFIGIINSIVCQPIVAENRGVMYREQAAGMYSIFPWIAGMVTVELLYCTIQTVLFSCILYFASGFARKADKFFWFLLFCWFTLMWFTLFGITAIAITPNVKVAAIVSSNFYSLVNLFAGFIIVRPEVPGWWIWLSWVNPFTYTLEGLIASQVGDFRNEMMLASGGTSTPREFIKESYGYRGTFLGQCVAILTSWLLVLFVMSYAAFRFLNFLQR